jgi:hypothetical protein
MAADYARRTTLVSLAPISITQQRQRLSPDTNTTLTVATVIAAADR